MVFSFHTTIRAEILHEASREVKATISTLSYCILTREARLRLLHSMRSILPASSLRKCSRYAEAAVCREI